MGQDKQRKSSKALLEEKHMKSYFRSLKRCKSKGVIDPEQKGSKSTKEEKTNGSNICEKKKEQKIKKEQKKDQRQCETLNTRLLGDLKPKNVTKIVNRKHLEEKMNEFNDVSFWKEPFPMVEICNLSQNPNQELKINVIDNDDNGSLQTEKNQDEADAFNSASFWKDPFPQVDINVILVKTSRKENVQVIDPSENKKVSQGQSQSEGQFTAVNFWKDPIPEVNLSDLLEINNDIIPKLGEGTVAYRKTNTEINEDLAKQCNTDEVAIELVKVNDELSEKMIVLEQENESLKNFLESVTDDIMNLEARIRALETKSMDKGTFRSADYTNGSQIPTRI